MFQRKAAAVAAVLGALALTACNIGRSAEPTPDVNALYTAAAETLVAQFNEQQTQTARAVTPTPQASPTSLASPSAFPTFALPGLTPLGTLLPGATPLPTVAAGGAVSFPVGCNDAKFISETIPDKTNIDAQKDFKKAWSMLNVGTCTWDEGYTFSFKSGERLSGSDIKITKEEDFTEPGESQAFVVTMKAPNKVGEFIGYWQMRDDAGTWFGSLVSVYIIVD
jgi:hypothetical protein